jgi:hypothetical protein
MFHKMYYARFICQIFGVLNFQFGGINVDVQLSESNNIINISGYRTGLAPALVINHTGYVVELWEKVNLPTVQVK